MTLLLIRRRNVLVPVPKSLVIDKKTRITWGSSVVGFIYYVYISLIAVFLLQLIFVMI